MQAAIRLVAMAGRAALALFVAALAIFLIVPVSSPAAGLAASPWPMFQHDRLHTGRSPYPVPDRPKVLWERKLDRRPGPAAIGADGTIYVPAGLFTREPNGFLYAINRNGTLRWRHSLGGLPGNTVPAVAADGTIYVHATVKDIGVGGGHEKLYAINPNGSRKWAVTLSAFGLNGSDEHSSPVIATNGTIYVGSWIGKLYAINPNGTVKWARSPTGSSITGSPALGGDGTIYFVDASYTLSAYNPNGTVKWNVRLQTGGGYELGSPSIGRDGTIYATSFRGLHAVTPAGKIKWGRPSPGDSIGRAIGSDGTIYTGGDALYAFTPAGAPKWKFGDLARLVAPVVGSNRTIVWRSGFDMAGVNPNGTRKWERFLGSFGDVSATIGAGRTLYAPVPEGRSLIAYGEG
jgi:large repetitive protein